MDKEGICYCCVDQSADNPPGLVLSCARINLTLCEDLLYIFISLVLFKYKTL